MVTRRRSTCLPNLDILFFHHPILGQSLLAYNQSLDLSHLTKFCGIVISVHLHYRLALPQLKSKHFHLYHILRLLQNFLKKSFFHEFKYACHISFAKLIHKKLDQCVEIENFEPILIN